MACKKIYYEVIQNEDDIALVWNRQRQRHAEAD